MRTSRSSSVQQARKALADRVREIRKDARLTGPALALLCGWHKSKVSRIENAVTAPSEQDIRDWCEACAADRLVADLVASLRSVEGMFVEWRRMERTGLKHAQEAVLPLFERTTRFRIYSPGLVHGLIQTRECTTAVLRDHGKTFAFLIEEACLYSGLGGPEMAAGQLGHLLTVAGMANVSLGVIPQSTLRHSMQVEGFSIYDNAQANVELVSGYLQLTQPYEVGLYVSRFMELSSDAVHGAAARSLIRAAIEAMA